MEMCGKGLEHSLALAHRKDSKKGSYLTITAIIPSASCLQR